MSVYDDIPAAIETRLTEMPGLPSAVRYPNVVFEVPNPADGESWLRVTQREPLV